MKIYLIRHGQTTGDVEKRYGGAYDDHLTAEGKRQSEHLAGQLTGKNIEMIFHSPLMRAAETAKILAEQMSCPLQETKSLRERNGYGILTGMTEREAREKYPDQVKLLKNINQTVVQGAETYEQFRQRFLEGINNIIESNTLDVIAIITHGGPIRCLLREQLDRKELRKLGDCGYFLLEKNNQGLRLISMHNASYL